MRTAGKSPSGISISVLKTGAIFVVFVFLLGEWVTPVSAIQAEKLRAEALQKKLSINQQGGLWIRHNERFIHAGRVVNREHLRNVEVFEFSDGELRKVINIQRAQKHDGKWQLTQIEEIAVSTDGIQRQQTQSATWAELVPTGMLDVLRISPDQMAASELRQYIRYLEENELDSKQYRLAFWNRFVQPLSILVMLMLAMPFIFTAQRSGGAGQRIFMGVLLGVGFFLLNRMLNQVGIVYGLPPFGSAVVTPLIFLVSAIYLVRRV